MTPALELLTPELIALMNREKDLGLAEKPSLFCEFHGISEAALNETAALAEALCRDGGALGFKSGVKERERKELWRARHEAWETIHRAYPGRETLIVDAAVPISSYPQMVLFSQQQLDEKDEADQGPDGSQGVDEPGEDVFIDARFKTLPAHPIIGQPRMAASGTKGSWLSVLYFLALPARYSMVTCTTAVWSIRRSI